MKGKILLTLALAALVILLGWAVDRSIDKSEIVECEKLRTQSQNYTGFYLLQWQMEQCQAHNININAPVK